MLHLATSSGGPGTGNGMVGAVAAIPLGLIVVDEQQTGLRGLQDVVDRQGHVLVPAHLQDFHEALRFGVETQVGADLPEPVHPGLRVRGGGDVHDRNRVLAPAAHGGFDLPLGGASNRPQQTARLPCTATQ
ncbi:DUF6223 family protein [Streptomyces nigra]